MPGPVALNQAFSEVIVLLCAGTVCAGAPFPLAEGFSSIHRPLFATHPPDALPSSASVCAHALDQLCHR